MHIVRRSLPKGVAVVVFKTVGTMVIAHDLLAEQSIQAIRLALWRAAPFAVVLMSELGLSVAT
jgi:hypothetical protein